MFKSEINLKRIHVKWLISISVLCMVAGGSLVAYAIGTPIYTSKAAYDHIQNATWDAIDISQDKPTDTNALYGKWLVQMRGIETPHKSLSDLGRGLCAAGLGGLAAISVWILYQRWVWMRSFKVLRNIWIMLWALQVPFAIWYYQMRAFRGDYPGWADSIMIPIVDVTFQCCVGAALSSILLSRLIKQRRFPEKISFDQPRNRIEWIRFMIFLSWFVILGAFVAHGIADGNEGDVFTCIVASSILLIFVSMPQDDGLFNR